MHVKQAEVHCLSPAGRGCAVEACVSLRVRYSLTIPHGGADVILSLEPMEALRYIPFLSAQGWVVANSAPFVNIPNYPEVEKVIADLKALPHVILLDVDALAKKTVFPGLPI